MAKRKPDPETQRLSFSDVPSSDLRIFELAAGRFHDEKIRKSTPDEEMIKHGLRRYHHDLTKPEQKQALKDYFQYMLHQQAKVTMGERWYNTAQESYRETEEELAENWNSRNHN